MSVWVGLAIAAFLLLLGMLGLLGGGLVVFQQVRKRTAVRSARAKRASLEAALPAASPPRASKHGKAQQVSIHERPTEAREAPFAKAAPPPPGPKPGTGTSPTLLPDVDDFEDDVPTGVFRPSQYQDIDAMMQEADKYVSTHKKGS